MGIAFAPGSRATRHDQCVFSPCRLSMSFVCLTNAVHQLFHMDPLRACLLPSAGDQGRWDGCRPLYGLTMYDGRRPELLAREHNRGNGKVV